MQKKTFDRRYQSIFELLFACALWGFGFVATILALRGGLSPNWCTGLRLGIAGAIALTAILIFPGWRRDLNWQQIQLAMMPGVWLSLTLTLQTWGLKYTSAVKSGFVTTLYVLLVPFLEKWWLGRKLPQGHFIAVAIALGGTYLICDFQGGNWNIGDLLTLACAVTASFQIFWFGLIGKQIKSSFVFNGLQTIWASFLPLLLAVLIETFPLSSPSTEAWWGMAHLIFGSTLLAFMLQVRAQKWVAPSLASLIFLMESPFAALFALLFLHEHLKSSQWFGALVIMLSVALATYLERRSIAKVQSK